MTKKKRASAKQPLRPQPDGGRWQEIARRIREDREARNISQVGLARLIDITPMQMWRYEDGRVRIPFARLEQIAKELDRPLERYVPAGERSRTELSPEQLRDMHGKLASLAMEAALKGTDEAIEALNDAIAEHHYRTGR